MKKQGNPFIVLQILCFAFCAVSGTAQNVLDASLVNRPPKLDGILEPEIWQEAITAANFTEQLPVPGGPVRQPSEVKVVYTHEALYVGFFCFDNQPDSILKQLSGRDGDGNSDWCSITVNCYQDGINGFIIPIRSSSAITEKLLYLYKNPDIAKAMGKNSLESVSLKGGWDNYFSIVLKEYSEILNTH